MVKLGKCKHGLTIGTCALCRGDKPTEEKKTQSIPDVCDYINNNFCINGATWLNRFEGRFDVNLSYRYKKEDADEKDVVDLLPKCDFCGKRFMENELGKVKNGKKICSVCVLKNKLQDIGEK